MNKPCKIQAAESTNESTSTAWSLEAENQAQGMNRQLKNFVTIYLQGHSSVKQYSINSTQRVFVFFFTAIYLPGGVESISANQR